MQSGTWHNQLSWAVLHTTVLLILANPLARGEQTLDSVPLPLVRAVLSSGGDGTFQFTTQLPASFPKVVSPDGFSFIGALETSDQIRIAFEGNAKDTNGKIELTTWLKEHGWQPYGHPVLMEYYGANELYCHEEEGTLAVEVLTWDSRVFLRLNHQKPSKSLYSACSYGSHWTFDQPGSGVHANGLDYALPPYMPSFQPPLGASKTPESIEGSISRRQSVRFIVDSQLNLQQMTNHLSKQLQLKNWSTIERISNASFTITTWHTSLDNGQSLLGVLTLFRQPGGKISAELVIVPRVQ